MNSIYHQSRSLRRKVYIAAAATVIAIMIIMLRKTLLNALTIIAGGAVIAFLTEPLSKLYERRFPRNLSALCALLTCIGTLLLGLWLLLPSLLAEMTQLIESLPDSVALIRKWIGSTVSRIERYLPGLSFPAIPFPTEQLAGIAKSTMSFVGGFADSFYRFSLMVILSYFFLCDRDCLMIRMELLIPRAARTRAIKTGHAVCRELKRYFKAQSVISALVGGLSWIGLMLLGVRSAFALGIVIGILNMIPYFGPVIGAIPAVLMAIGDGWTTALGTVLVLWVIQQLDSTFISPRIMGSISGVSPAVVLLAIFIGAGIGGIFGMLLAVPFVMAYRTVFRVFVQRHENV